MPRYIAFLRAINVGGRTVTMDRLRLLFESLGHSNVETFIASGNVIFESRSKSASALQIKIENCLREALGYEVPAMLRTDVEVAAAAEHAAFSASKLKSATAINVGFVTLPLSADRISAVAKFNTDIDSFQVNGRHIYWLCKIRQSESKFSAPAFERMLGTPVTFRNVNTVKKLAAKYPPTIVKVRGTRP